MPPSPSASDPSASESAPDRSRPSHAPLPAAHAAAVAELNDAQREAVEHRDGPLMIVAGPGSGKTRVITHRIAHLVHSGVPGAAILAITFTNKAAREMLDRTLTLLGMTPQDPDAPVLSTFHAFCARLLRREIYRVDPYRIDYSIYDTDDQKAVVTEVLDKLELAKGNFPPGGVLSQISRWKNELVSPDDAKEAAGTFREESVAKIYRRYQELLEERNALDFDDLLIVTLRLLTEHPDVLEKRRRFHRYLLIDEFQDTNRPQYYIARLLGEGHGNLCVTGDPDQSIYSWRGASPLNFTDFQHDFADHRAVFLSQNYRSTPEILAVAGRLTGTGVGRRELFTENPSGENVMVQGVGSERDEARTIVQRVATLASEQVPLGEIAVLYRMTSLSRTVEEELMRSGIPYSIVGGTPFYNRREIKDVICYLRAAASPLDTIAFRRVINTPGRGIGKKSLETLTALADARGVSLGEAIEDDDILSQVGRARKALTGFRTILHDLREVRNLSLAGQIERVLETTAYHAYLEKSEPQTAQERSENLEELLSAATEAEILYAQAARERGEKPDDPLPSFLERIALMSDLDDWDDNRDRVTLMTLHAAKGLEFDHVMIAGVEDSILPHSRHIEEGNLDEERRLLYVGITRARTTARLYYTNYRRLFGQREPRRPSPFLDDIRGDGLTIEDTFDEWYGGGGGYGGPARSSGSGWGRGRKGSSEAGGNDEWSEYASDTDFDEFGGEDFGDPWDDAVAGDSEELRPGTGIEHAVYGRGVIEAINGAGRSRRLTVRFDEHGRHQLVGDLSSLRIISSPDGFDEA